MESNKSEKFSVVEETYPHFKKTDDVIANLERLINSEAQIIVTDLRDLEKIKKDIKSLRKIREIFEEIHEKLSGLDDESAKYKKIEKKRQDLAEKYNPKLEQLQRRIQKDIAHLEKIGEIIRATTRDIKHEIQDKWEDIDLTEKIVYSKLYSGGAEYH